MARQLGINQIGSLGYQAILAGDFPRVTADVTAGTSALKMGSVIKLNANGTIDLAGATDDIYGVLADDLDSTDVGVAFLTGEFVGPRLTLATGQTWISRVSDARKVSLFFKDASLAPNQ